MEPSKQQALGVTPVATHQAIPNPSEQPPTLRKSLFSRGKPASSFVRTTTFS